MRKLNKSGFTIVELMIATTVFGVLMLITTGAMMFIGKQFYKGVISSRTQEVTRTITDELSRGIQFSSTAPEVYDPGGNSPVASVCVSGKEYVLLRNRQLSDQPTNSDQSRRVMVRFDDCQNRNSMPASGGTELLAEGMRITKFSLTPITTGRAWRLEIRIAHGEGDLLDANGFCKNEADSHYCSTAQSEVTVFRRL